MAEEVASIYDGATLSPQVLDAMSRAYGIVACREVLPVRLVPLTGPH